MASIIEDAVVIKFSKLVKDSEQEQTQIVGEDIQQALEQVAQELVADNIIVEVIKA